MKKSSIILAVILLFLGIGTSQAANKAKITFTNGKYLQADWVYIYHSNVAARFNSWCRKNNQWVNSRPVPASQKPSQRCGFQSGNVSKFIYDGHPSPLGRTHDSAVIRGHGEGPKLSQSSKQYGYTYGRAYNGLQGNAASWGTYFGEGKSGGLVFERNTNSRKARVCVGLLKQRCTRWMGGNTYRKGAFSILNYAVATKQYIPQIGRLKNLHWNGRKIR